jgi:hypothetical protein
LIDSFILRLQKATSNKAFQALIDFESFVEEELYTFYQHDVALCPDQERSFRLLIAAVVEKTGEFDAWVSKNVRIHRIGGMISSDGMMFCTTI